MGGEGAITKAYHSSLRVGGLTHGLYRYPARFSPELVRAAIERFTTPGDWVADPFVGGGTTAVEALALARRVVAFDVNPLSTLLTGAKTTLLSPREVESLRTWALVAHASPGPAASGPEPDARLRNAPPHMVEAFGAMRETIALLPTRNAQAAARSVLIHAGQQLIDGRIRPGSADDVPRYVDSGLERLFAGLNELGDHARMHGALRSEVASMRMLRTGRAHELAPTRPFNRLAGRVRLVVTSPPYPGVHVLYHRWQVNGRAETPFAYWLSDLQDGFGPKHYTMGGRTQLGEVEYFDIITQSWTALRRLLAKDATTVQVVAFAEPERQLGQYLSAMEAAGYRRIPEEEPSSWRVVPNRKWYFRARPGRGQAQEVLLVHRPVA